jgi:hypothetical protein
MRKTLEDQELAMSMFNHDAKAGEFARDIYESTHISWFTITLPVANMGVLNLLYGRRDADARIDRDTLTRQTILQIAYSRLLQVLALYRFSTFSHITGTVLPDLMEFMKALIEISGDRTQIITSIFRTFVQEFSNMKLSLRTLVQLACHMMFTPGSPFELLYTSENESADFYIRRFCTVFQNLRSKTTKEFREIVLGDVLQWRETGFASLLAFLNTDIMMKHHAEQQFIFFRQLRKNSQDLLDMLDGDPSSAAGGGGKGQRTTKAASGGGGKGKRTTKASERTPPPPPPEPVVVHKVNRAGDDSVVYADGVKPCQDIGVLIAAIRDCTPVPSSTLWWLSHIRDSDHECWMRMLILKNNIDRQVVSALKDIPVTVDKVRTFCNTSHAHKKFLEDIVCDIHAYVTNSCGLLGIPTVDENHAKFLTKLWMSATDERGLPEPQVGEIMNFGLGQWLLVVETNMSRDDHEWCKGLTQKYQHHKNNALLPYIRAHYDVEDDINLYAFLPDAIRDDDDDLKDLCRVQMQHRLDTYLSRCTLSPKGVNVIHQGLLHFVEMIAACVT